MNSYQYSIKCHDFSSLEIQEFARQKGLHYEANVKPDVAESGLYVAMGNAAGSAFIEKDQLSFEVEGHRCEMFFGCREMETSVTKKIPNGARKNDQMQGYELTLTFSIDLQQPVADVYVESKILPTLGSILGSSRTAGSGYKKVQLEGDFNDFFTVRVRSDSGLSAFRVLAPNIMLDILRRAQNYDVEFVGSKIYIYRPMEVTTTYNGAIGVPITFAEYKDLLEFGIDHARKLVRTSLPGYTPVGTSLTVASRGFDRVALVFVAGIAVLMILGTFGGFIFMDLAMTSSALVELPFLLVSLGLGGAVLYVLMRIKLLKRRAISLATRYSGVDDASTIIRPKLPTGAHKK